MRCDASHHLLHLASILTGDQLEGFPEFVGELLNQGIIVADDCDDRTGRHSNPLHERLIDRLSVPPTGGPCTMVHRAD